MLALVYDEKEPRYFWGIAIATGVLPSREFEVTITLQTHQIYFT